VWQQITQELWMTQAGFRNECVLVFHWYFKKNVGFFTISPYKLGRTLAHGGRKEPEGWNKPVE